MYMLRLGARSHGLLLRACLQNTLDPDASAADLQANQQNLHHVHPRFVLKTNRLVHMRLKKEGHRQRGVEPSCGNNGGPNVKDVKEILGRLRQMDGDRGEHLFDRLGFLSLAPVGYLLD